MVGEFMLKALETPIKESFNSVFTELKSRTEAIDLLSKYKEKHLGILINQVDKIKIFGMSEPIDLLRIYAPTRVSTTIHRRLYEVNWHKIDDGGESEDKGLKGKIVNAESYVEENNRIVVLAPPGSGKTTFLKFIALSYSNSELQEKTKLKRKLLPFFLHLPTISESESDIDEFIAKKLSSGKDVYAEAFVYRKFVKGDAVILLDSLDEVPSTNKKTVMDKIKILEARYPKLKIIISCRIADYEEILENFKEVEIAKLNKTAITKIVKAWFKGEPTKSQKLLNHIDADYGVASLTETPLLLSLICIQYRNDLNIPNRKTELYKRCTDALIRDWDTTRGFRRDTLFASLTDERKARLFGRIASYFLIEKDSYAFESDSISDVVADYCSRFGIEPSREVGLGIVNEIESHHGIIEKNSAESWVFSHPSFQEYYCATNLIATRGELRFVKSKFDSAIGKNVVPFITGSMEDPTAIFEFLKGKSDLKDLKNFPTLAKRINNIHLMYKCLNSGASIESEFKTELLHFIAGCIPEMSRIFELGRVYPIPVLEESGIRQVTYSYENKKKTFSLPLLSYVRLCNEMLMSPIDEYSEIAIKTSNELLKTNGGNIVDNVRKTSIVLTMLLPAASAKPVDVVCLLNDLKKQLGDEYFEPIRKFIDQSIDITNRLYYQ